MKEWLALERRSKTSLLLTATLVFSCLLGIDIHTPSLPHMVRFFNASENLLQLAVTMFTLGAGIAVLFWGPLSDKYGRKIILSIGALIVITFAFLATMCTNIYLFLFIRLLQGMGAGAAMCIGRVVAADLLTKKELAVIGATMGLITGMAPMIAPIIGGYMETFFGWQGSFIIYGTITSFAFLLFATFFEESIEEFSEHSNFLTLYAKVLSSRHFLHLCLLQGLVLSIINCYAVIAPFLVQVEMGKTPLFFGWLSGFCASCQLFSKAGSPSLIRRFTSYRTQFLGWGAMTISSLILLSRLFSWTFHNPLMNEGLFVLGIGFAFLSIHLIVPFIFSEALTLTHAKKGIISAGLTASGMLISFCLSTIIALVPYEGSGLLGSYFLAVGIAGFAISYQLKKYH